MSVFLGVSNRSCVYINIVVMSISKGRRMGMNSLFFCKQKTVYEVRMSDWSSDVCSSDLGAARELGAVIVLGRNVDDPAVQSTELDTDRPRSEERRVGTSVSGRVDLGGRRIINNKMN